MKLIKESWKRSAAGALALAILLGPAAIRAQEQDPPSRPNPDARAARLSFVQGEVVLTQGNQILADPALANTPLFEGTVVATKDDGRAELQFDDGTVARLSPNSTMAIAVLHMDGGVSKAELVLQSGLGYFELGGNGSSSQVTTRFGDSAVTASGFTVIRVNLDNPPGEVAVFTGNAHLTRGTSISVDLSGGQSIALNGADPNQYTLAETIEPDSWDAWNADRDQDLSTQEAAKTAATGSQPSSSNPAWGDLDANGNWYNVPGQGYVWSPYVAANASWDPYGCGNWVWTPQFGYVWVSCESWGYLPYTTGYWNYYDGFGWGWMPGYGYPWWFTGGWSCNVGYRPARYDPPHRPKSGPIHPVEPIHHGGYYQPNPVVVVNRNPGMPKATPARPVARPVTIAGSSIEPLRPLAPRPVYNHQTAIGSGRALLGGTSAGGTTTGYNPWANSPATPRRGTGTVPATGGSYHGPATSPSAGAGGTYHPYSGGTYRAPTASPSTGGTYRPAPMPGGVSRPSMPAPAPRVSGGGGGGHVSAPSGGGHVSAPSGGGAHVSAPSGNHH
jgi:hypothetical protein